MSNRPVQPDSDPAPASGRTTRLSSGSLARRSYALPSRQLSTGTQPESLQAGSQFAAALLGSGPTSGWGVDTVDVDPDSDVDAPQFGSDTPAVYPPGYPLASPPVDTRRSRSASRDHATAGPAPISFTPVATTTTAGARQARLEAMASGPQLQMALPPATGSTTGSAVRDPLASFDASTWASPHSTRGMTASQREGPTEDAVPVRIALSTASTTTLFSIV